MINCISVAIANGTNPYENLAFEELILNSVKEKEVILYVWQNQNTVVIGKNQNCYFECKVEQIENDGGFLARRMSGGGAVFHDLGNVNFTFVAQGDNYNVNKQMDVILQAVKALGIRAKKSGRNDIEVQGRKFSGNAFYKTGNRNMHHGTLLLSADMSALSKYLTVETMKLKSHGVKSVKSRVVNLCELNSEITPQCIKKELINAFEHVYNLKAQQFNNERIDKSQLEELTKKYASEQWRKGVQKQYTYSLKHHFKWGIAQPCLQAKGNKIISAVLYTDALDVMVSEYFKQALENCEFSSSAIYNALSGFTNCTDKEKEMLCDLAELLKQELI